MIDAVLLDVLRILVRSRQRVHALRAASTPTFLRVRWDLVPSTVQGRAIDCLILPIARVEVSGAGARDDRISEDVILLGDASQIYLLSRR